MAKGDDVARRKKNKKLRKKSDLNSLSSKAAAAVAAKKRRKAGKRRLCQGMCYSLPTPEDPFNDKHGKEEIKTRGPKTKPTRSPKDDIIPLNGESGPGRKGAVGRDISQKLKQQTGTGSVAANNSLGRKCIKNSEKKNIEVADLCGARQLGCEIPEFPSKFVFWCLSEIENALRHGDAYTDGEGNSFFLNSWGLEFLKCYSTGKDLMDTSGTSATTEQIAWVVSGAADTFERKEKHILSSACPFLLFLVPSHEKAVQVRTVCKPLKSAGIHTVSVHPGASLDHQIQGLRSCEPEFLISTPERLLELISMKAIDISGISMLVIDGLNTICSAGHTDTLKSIKKFISGNPRMVVFNDSFNHMSIPMVRYLLTGSICRLSVNNSITNLSSCIIQSVKVCTSEEDKLVQSVEVLDQFLSSGTQNSNLLYILRKDAKCHKLVKALKSKDCSISRSVTASSNDSVDLSNRLRPAVSVIDVEHISNVNIGTYDVIVLPCFVPSMDTYVHILTKMARQSANGVLHGFLTEGDVEVAGPLIAILEQCGQEVPQDLQHLHNVSNMVS